MASPAELAPPIELVPPSREVRLADGITQGAMEWQVHRAAEGGTMEELGAINALELIIANERRKAAEELGRILLARMCAGFGNLVGEDVINGLRDFHHNEILDLRYQAPLQIEVEE